MKDRYYMKDVMKRFRIGRDTIKYYEKQGIIEGYRDANGYRYYDYLALKRMERVLQQRSLGFSVEQIKRFLKGLSAEEEMRLNEEIIQELETKIHLLQAKLELAKNMSYYCKDLLECYKHYQIKHDFEMCLECEEECRSGRNRRNRENLEHSLLSEVRVYNLGKDFTLSNEKIYECAVIGHIMQFHEACGGCHSEHIVRGPVVYGIIKMNNMHQFPAFLHEIQTEIQDEYQLGDTIYCLYNYYIEAEPREEGIAIGFYIPVTRKGDAV